MKFREYITKINEQDELAQIKIILDELTAEEIDELGYYMYSEFFDCDEGEECEDEFTIEDILAMLDEVDEEFYSDILDMLQVDELDLDDSEVELDEAYVEYRGKYYDVMYDVRKGYVAVGKGPYKNQIKRRSFTKLDDAKEHAELELDLDEGVSRIMKQRNMNRKKRKYMSTSRAKLRRTAAQRKRANRMNKNKRKRYYRANKQKIAAYQKSRRAAIKKGKHKVKIRRSAG
jgi:hypothetical protein